MAQDDRHSLITLLKTLRAEVNLEVTEKRREFIREHISLIENWQGQLPNLLEIFREEEIKWLLAESVKKSSICDAISLAKFAIRCGYRDEPDLDEDGKPILRRTTLIHHAAMSDGCGSSILDLFTMYNRFDVNYIDEAFGNSHFHIACEYGFVDVVEKFLESGQDPNCVETGESPLLSALMTNEMEVAKLLSRHGANLLLASKNGSTPLHIISMVDRDGRSTETFFEICSDRRQTLEIDARDNLGNNTPLHVAAYHGSTRMVESLLRRGADPNSVNEDGQTPLHKINGWVNEDTLKTFLDICDALNRPVEIDARDNKGNTPLHLAATRGHDDTIELLLRRGADPNSANEAGQTPLHRVCKGHGRLEPAGNDSTKLFLDVCDALNRTARIDVRDGDGLTPLGWAVASVKPAAVDLLLDRGADPSSGFVFPAASHLADACGYWRRDANLPTFKLKLASGLLDCLERLERRGYELERGDALAIMRFFAEREMFRNDARNWCSCHAAAEALTRTKLKQGLSLQDLIQAPAREAKKLMTRRDYYDFACSRIDTRLYLCCGRAQTACEADLCERASRGFFELRALQPFLELIHHRLPTEMCEFIMEHLSNEDLYNVCLAATPQDQIDPLIQ